jgi:hypothetical protein
MHGAELGSVTQVIAAYTNAMPDSRFQCLRVQTEVAIDSAGRLRIPGRKRGRKRPAFPERVISPRGTAMQRQREMGRATGHAFPDCKIAMG